MYLIGIQADVKIVLPFAPTRRMGLWCDCYDRSLCGIMTHLNALRPHSARFLHFLFTVQEAIFFWAFFTGVLTFLVIDGVLARNSRAPT